VSKAVDRHIDKAFASLDDLSMRELEATADALPRRHSLYAFANVFRSVAHAREGGWNTNIPRYHVSEFVSRADDEVLALLEQAQAPFWGHVRKAILACRSVTD
jgi:hypothetical protein